MSPILRSPFRRASRRIFANPAFCALTALAAGVTVPSQAQTSYSWGNTGTDWNTAADWTPNTGFPGSSGPPPATTADVASFDSAAVTNPNLSGSVSIASVNFSTAGSSGYTLSATNAATLTLNSVVTTGSTVALNSAITSGANTVSAPIVFGAAGATTQTVQQALGGTLNLTGNLSNTNAITLQLGNTGTGTIALSGTSVGLTANIKLNGAILSLANDTALGSGTFTFGTTSTVTSADANTRTISNALGSFGGTSPVYSFGLSTATTGDLVFSSTTSAAVSGANARTFTVNNANTTIAAPLTASTSATGGGGIKKLGTGNLILLGANTYAGSSGSTASVYGQGTTITAGTLTIGNGTTAGAALPTTSQVVNNSALVINNTATDANTISGNVVGTGTLTKNGAGSLTLAALTPATTTYTSGSVTATVSVTTGLAVGASVTGTGIAAGTTIATIGAVANGATTITLSAAPTSSGTTATFGNTFSGNIAINNGALIGNSGAGNSPTLSLGAGSISIGATGTLGATQPDQALLGRITSAAAGSVLGFSTGFNGTATLDFSASPSLTNITLGATSNVTIAPASVITPANNLYRIGGGAGVLTVAGPVINGANNSLEVNGSVIVGSNPLAYGGSTTINNGGRLRLAADNRIPAGTALTVNTGGVFDLGNTDAGTTSTVASLAGAGLVTNSSSSATAPNKILAVNPAAGVTTTYSGVIEDHTSTAIAGATLGLTKTGAGTLILTGANTYSGGASPTVGTNINGGFLRVNNTTGSATGTSLVAVNGTSSTDFGTLGGGAGAANGGILIPLAGGATSRTYGANAVGIVSGQVALNNFGHIAPGNSVGTLTVASLTLATGSVLDYEFNGTANDLTAVTGALTLSTGTPGSVTINLFQEGTSNAFAAAGVYNLLSYGAGSVIDPTSLAVANKRAGFNYNITNDAADGLVQLTVTAVPEPGAWVMALVGAGALGFVRFRRGRAGV